MIYIVYILYTSLSGSNTQRDKKIKVHHCR